MMLVSFFCSVYYNVILAWSCFYFYNSFRNEIPWAGCNHAWNTKSCFADLSTSNATTTLNSTISTNRSSPSSEFFM